MLSKDKQILQNIYESIDKIVFYIKDIKDADSFFDDQKTFDAVLMNFINIGEMVNKLSNKFKEQHSEIDWYKIKAFRNLVAHDYFGVDAEEVWQRIQNHLPELRLNIKTLL